MEIIFGWIIFSFVVGFVGYGRKIGFFGAFLLSILLSPVIGLIIALVSKNKADEAYKDKILKIQQNQQLTLEKLSETEKEKTVSDITAELKKIKELLDNKVITQDEFEKLKNRVIESINNTDYSTSDSYINEKHTEHSDNSNSEVNHKYIHPLYSAEYERGTIGLAILTISGYFKKASKVWVEVDGLLLSEAQITDNSFALKLSTPPFSVLKPISNFIEISESLQISNLNAKYVIVQSVKTDNEACEYLSKRNYESSSSSISESYIFVDENVLISGTTENESEIFNLNLKKGWNIFSHICQPSGVEEFYTGLRTIELFWW